ncbi:uncharacterized protein LOC142626604 [Castanea sativa]|uniref:uncharacterized protein LOC142626604 n=1 Tax=Castanea sativa TaxID=21020 RepID=UPI003F651229
MKEYLKQVKNRMHNLNAKFVQIPREENERADRLAKAASAEHMSFPSQKDAQVYVKTYDKCQRFGNLIRQPMKEFIPMTTPWPFAQWGLDIMGPFPIVIRQLKFLLVGIYYFTKWVEAKALATITEKSVRSFVWRNIICRYGIPRILVLENEKQFDNDAFRDFCL